MNRKALATAPYNPRQIDEASRKKLKASLKRIGLVSPIVMNEKTGHIVSGHQRIGLIDQIEGRQDYELDVAVINVDEKTEKEINIFLNNELAMGSWDLTKLDEMMKDGLDFGNCGFEKFELNVMLPSFAAPMSEGLKAQTKEVAAVVGELDEDLKRKRETRKKIREEMQARDAVNKPEIGDPELYVVLCFPNREISNEFLQFLKMPITEKYISGKMVFDLLAERKKSESPKK